MAVDVVTEGLNPEQLAAVEAVRGPVCILAGAGSGKTTTITRRIAHQVASKAFDPGSILAVTFTDKAAGEMRSRLERLGVAGVRARTFHSAALAQLRGLSETHPADILPSKAMALRQIGNTLPKPYRFRPAGDLASEIEWAKNRRISADDYEMSLRGHEPPIPIDLMASVYKRYEKGKRAKNLVDFEDLLELAIQLFNDDEYARERFAARYLAFTVDEYQDVNLLQETLLRAWVGERDDLCVVGDDYQSIYGFTGASPQYLLEMPTRFPRVRVIRLEKNYRSTPEVLTVANKLVPKLGGAEKVLEATRSSGPEPALRPFPSTMGESSFLINRIRELKKKGVALEDMAILYRVNFRSEDYEESLAEAGIAFQVKDGAFLNRGTARRILTPLKRSKETAVAAAVRKAADNLGYVEKPEDDLGDQELTRQNDLARFVRLAEEFDDGTKTAAAFVTDIEARFGPGSEGGRGINLLTYHRAKGLEFEAVFLPRCEEGELPFRRSRTPEAISEERRLFYVGITRAKTHLAISWVADGKHRVSPFVRELLGEKPGAGRGMRKPMRAPTPPEVITAELGTVISAMGFEGEIVEVGEDTVVMDIGGARMSVDFGEMVTSGGRRLPLGPAPSAENALLIKLKAWRLERARADEVPAYVVFHDATLEAIAELGPNSEAALSTVSGVGPAKLERYGADILEVIASSQKD